MDELVGLLAPNTTPLRTHIVFCKPNDTSADWGQSALWRQALAMKSVDVCCDEGDRERSLFGALTAGQAFLYDPAGQLRFQGGITAGRGASGPNIGLQSVGAWLRAETEVRRKAPVFGCPLTSD